jgi:hypothetical protein
VFGERGLGAPASSTRSMLVDGRDACAAQHRELGHGEAQNREILSRMAAAIAARSDRFLLPRVSARSDTASGLALGTLFA